MWPYKPVFRFLGWGVSETEAAMEANRQVPLGDVHSVSESVCALALPLQLSQIFLSLLWQELMPMAMTHPQPLSARVQPA